MFTGTIIFLGAIAGLTIYLGLPFAFLKSVPPSLQNFASMVATGVLIFLLYDVLSKASEPIVQTIEQIRIGHANSQQVSMQIALLVSGLVIGLLGLVYFNKYIIARFKSGTRVQIELGSTGIAPAAGTLALSARAEITPHTLALMIATGIGLHNFSEGLAIGQSAAAGSLQLASILIIGFGLHNMTEGFGIAGPITGRCVSRRFIFLLGLIGGAPTFLGTALGVVFYAPSLFTFFLALAAGAIIYVVTELLGVAKRFQSQDLVMWGLLLGFLLAYGTDLIITFAGA